jgi:hypothetical protein
MFALLIGVVGGLGAVGWIVWAVVDWGNDYYIVTNRRVIYLEKIVGIYDSRQESPLYSVLSVDVQTAGFLERSFGIGDVVVRTFSGPITMKSMANPQALAALVEEHWNRTKTREREAQVEAMKEAVRQRVVGPAKPPPPPRPASAPAKRPSVGAQVAQFFSFQVRFELGESVVYRKHWYMLAEKTWIPSLFIFAVAGLVGLHLSGVFLANVSPGIVFLVALVTFIPFALWWLYEYVDWKNDIYQVTPEQILDLHKTPLGRESRKSAPLENILSLKYERPGLLGVLLNYGTVVALVGGQEFRFDGVFDPVSVQNDIYRRIEARNSRKAQAEAGKRRDEIADWLGVYHAVSNEKDGTQPSKK